jgi:hypothetical protein
VRIKASAEDTGWNIRETAWGLQERVLWRGSDAARAARSSLMFRTWRATSAARKRLAPLARRLAREGAAAARLVARGFEPLQRLVQSKIVWPLSDRLDDHGPLARTLFAVILVATAAVAGAAGLRLAPSDDALKAANAVAGGPVATETAAASSLSGVKPDFKQGEATDPVAAEAQPPVAPPPFADPPEKVAWQFAEAFVGYEVGKADEYTQATFAQVADDPLAKALAEDPPRLPKGTEVPEAKVLNVVLGERQGTELEASVSLVRLEAASELRLTLRETPEGWQVAEVRG